MLKTKKTIFMDKKTMYIDTGQVLQLPEKRHCLPLGKLASSQRLCRWHRSFPILDSAKTSHLH